MLVVCFHQKIPTGLNFTTFVPGLYLAKWMFSCTTIHSYHPWAAVPQGPGRRHPTAYCLAEVGSDVERANFLSNFIQCCANAVKIMSAFNRFLIFSLQLSTYMFLCNIRLLCYYCICRCMSDTVVDPENYFLFLNTLDVNCWKVYPSSVHQGSGSTVSFPSGDI